MMMMMIIVVVVVVVVVIRYKNNNDDDNDDDDDDDRCSENLGHYSSSVVMRGRSEIHLDRVSPGDVLINYITFGNVFNEKNNKTKQKLL